MNLLRELSDAIEGYVERRSSLEDLGDVLTGLALPISEGEDAEAELLAARVWRLLSEHGYGHRSETSLRREFGRLIPVRLTAPESRTTARSPFVLTSHAETLGSTSSAQALRNRLPSKPPFV